MRKYKKGLVFLVGCVRREGVSNPRVLVFGSMKAAMKLFGARLKALRAAQGMSAPALAEQLRVNQSSIYNMEAGLFSPSFETMQDLATALGVDLVDLFATPGAHVRYDLIELTRTLQLGALVELKKVAEGLKRDQDEETAARLSGEPLSSTKVRRK